ncbi:hypothetical protein ACFYTQ_12495 [Nocardia sp. NPDC004068]|uniref:hypothetical protein n=1 Tax=Nocardia sp. NPDC004068 TaxID=3364303 RepID=UPI0036967298
MRLNPPTEEELRRAFAEELRSARTGGGLSTDTGLDSTTEAALWEILRAYPDVPTALVEEAERAFAGQLDGTNAAARKVRLEEMFEQVKREEGQRP